MGFYILTPKTCNEAGINPGVLDATVRQKHIQLLTRFVPLESQLKRYTEARVATIKAEANATEIKSELQKLEDEERRYASFR